MPARRLRTSVAAGAVAAVAALGAGGEAEGARRPYRIPLAAQVEEAGADLALSFELPKGSYATVVLRELLEAEAPPQLDAYDSGVAW